MSGELATLLSGRTVELQMLPLSFKEFCAGLDQSRQTLTNNEKLNLYIENGSFPYLVKFSQYGRPAKEYLRDIYQSILLKDIVLRLHISDVNNLENITKFLLHNIGNKVSSTNISNTLKSAGKGMDQKTVDKYIRGSRDSLLLYEAKRYHIKGKQYLSTNR